MADHTRKQLVASQERRFEKLARHQGVDRPYRILVSMTREVRDHLAAVLGLRRPRDRDVPAAAEAWRIINADLWGIQARSHGPKEQLVPLARNHNWWEILMSAARRLKLKVYPGLSEAEVERMVFEAAAARVVGKLSEAEVAELDRLASEEPGMTSALRDLGLTGNGLRLVLAGLARIARTRGRLGDAGRALGRSARSYLASALKGSSCLPSVTGTLRFLNERYLPLVMAWSSMEALWCGLGRARARFVTVIASLHFHSLLEEGLEEAEMLRA